MSEAATDHKRSRWLLGQSAISGIYVVMTASLWI